MMTFCVWVGRELYEKFCSGQKSSSLWINWEMLRILRFVIYIFILLQLLDDSVPCIMSGRDDTNNLCVEMEVIFKYPTQKSDKPQSILN